MKTVQVIDNKGKVKSRRKVGGRVIGVPPLKGGAPINHTLPERPTPKRETTRG